MPITNPELRKQYARDWIAKRRAAFMEGKTCADCGATKRLELDHNDPGQKIAHRIWSWSLERRQAEIAKCTIRCKRCHTKKHVLARRRHGTARFYIAGCRCELCKTAMSITAAKWKRGRELAAERRRELTLNA